MRSFQVTVNPKSIFVQEFKAHANKHPDYVAIIDGERTQYFVGKHPDCENKNWRDAARMQLYYHAKNSGNVVRFLPVTKAKRKRKKDISEKQLSLL